MIFYRLWGCDSSLWLARIEQEVPSDRQAFRNLPEGPVLRRSLPTLGKSDV
jgi:hypothetical protein